MVTGSEGWKGFSVWSGRQHFSLRGNMLPLVEVTTRATVVQRWFLSLHWSWDRFSPAFSLCSKPPCPELKGLNDSVLTVLYIYSGHFTEPFIDVAVRLTDAPLHWIKKRFIRKWSSATFSLPLICLQDLSRHRQPLLSPWFFSHAVVGRFKKKSCMLPPVKAYFIIINY